MDNELLFTDTIHSLSAVLPFLSTLDVIRLARASKQMYFSVSDAFPALNSPLSGCTVDTLITGALNIHAFMNSIGELARYCSLLYNSGSLISRIQYVSTIPFLLAVE